MLPHIVFGHTNLLNSVGISNTNYILAEFINMVVAVANSSFLIISGYYAINSKAKIKKVLMLWGKTLFYSISIYAVYAIFFNKTQHAYESFLPIITGQYWFISAYIALYLLLPVINIMIKKLSKAQFKYLLVLLIVFYGIMRITFNPATIFTGGFGPVVLLYLIGAYIRLHVEIKKEKQYYFLKYILVTIVVTWLVIMLNALFVHMEHSIENFDILKLLYTIKEGITQFSSILLIIAVILLFMKFKTMEIKNKFLNKLITIVSPSVFSIYLIHENINNRGLWTELANPVQYNNSFFLIPYILLIVLCVFVICLIIDLIRIGLYKLIKRIPIVKAFIDKLNGKIDMINQKLSDFLE